MKTSKYVREILADLEANPEAWVRFGSTGLKKGNIVIMSFGNTAIFSICNVYVNDEPCIGLTYMDKYLLEKAFYKWMRNASVEMLLKR